MLAGVLLISHRSPLLRGFGRRPSRFGPEARVVAEPLAQISKGKMQSSIGARKGIYAYFLVDMHIVPNACPSPVSGVHTLLALDS
jgi:hypothetical protein